MAIKLIETAVHEGIKTEKYMMDYYKVKVEYTSDGKRAFTVESKLFNHFDRKYLPEIVYDDRAEKFLAVQDLGTGAEKMVEGYRIAAETVKELNGKFMGGKDKTMKLYDWMNSNLDEDDMVTVTDKDYDMEAYFCTFGPDSEPDDFDFAMEKLSRVLDVVDVGKDSVVVNLGELIERNYEKVKGLFRGGDVADIAESMTTILAGYCSGAWLSKFADALA